MNEYKPGGKYIKKNLIAGLVIVLIILLIELVKYIIVHMP